VLLTKCDQQILTKHNVNMFTDKKLFSKRLCLLEQDQEQSDDVM